jgi:hypothetical protein
MSNLVRILVIFVAIVASLVVMAGCGIHSHAKDTDVSGYPYRYADFDYKYAWKTTAADKGLLIAGVMKNVRYAFIDSVLLTVNAIDKDGKIIATATDFPMPQQTRQDEVSFFSLLLKDVKPAPGDILQFRVHYTGNEGNPDGTVDWHGSFKVDAMTGAAIIAPRKNPGDW